MASLDHDAREWSWGFYSVSLSSAVYAVTGKITQLEAGFMRDLAKSNGAFVLPTEAAQAALFLRRADHGSPLWRLLVCIASGKVTREDLRILAEVVEALADGLHLRRPAEPPRAAVHWGCAVKALSIRQPWLFAIMHLGKRLENRSWYCHHRGPILLHASKWWQADEIRDTVLDLATLSEVQVYMRANPRPPCTLQQLGATGGHLLAVADVVDCLRPGATVPEGQAHWYMGEFALVLDNVRPLKAPVPCRGALGLFDVPDALVAAFLAGVSDA